MQWTSVMCAESEDHRSPPSSSCDRVKRTQVLQKSGECEEASNLPSRGGEGCRKSEMTSVKVAVRVRPLNHQEIRMCSKMIVDVQGKTVLVRDLKVPENQGLDHRPRVHMFTFDYCFGPMDDRTSLSDPQILVYEEVGRQALEALLRGYNCSVIAYGQSSSGKTFTMMGSADHPGLTPLICQGLLSRVANLRSEAISCKTDVSFLEVYNERVYDLLHSLEVDNKKSKLRVREHPVHGPFVEGLSSHRFSNMEGVSRLISSGNENRVKAATAVRGRSSKSHAIFSIRCSQAFLQETKPTEVVSRLHLVDLAGSERANQQSTQNHFQEGGSINKSLVTLGNVISALAEAALKPSEARNSKRMYIPYRDSVVTWLLKDSLGGNSLTFMVAAVSPASSCFSETLSTLRFAQRARSIMNTPVANERVTTRHVLELRAEVEKIYKQMTKPRLEPKMITLTRQRNLKPNLPKREAKQVDRRTTSWRENWCGTYDVTSKVLSCKEQSLNGGVKKWKDVEKETCTPCPASADVGSCKVHETDEEDPRTDRLVDSKQVENSTESGQIVHLPQIETPKDGSQEDNPSTDTCNASSAIVCLPWDSNVRNGLTFYPSAIRKSRSWTLLVGSSTPVNVRHCCSHSFPSVLHEQAPDYLQKSNDPFRQRNKTFNTHKGQDEIEIGVQTRFITADHSFLNESPHLSKEILPYDSLQEIDFDEKSKSMESFLPHEPQHSEGVDYPIKLVDSFQLPPLENVDDRNIVSNNADCDNVHRTENKTYDEWYSATLQPLNLLPDGTSDLGKMSDSRNGTPGDISPTGGDKDSHISFSGDISCIQNGKNINVDLVRVSDISCDVPNDCAIETSEEQNVSIDHNRENESEDITNCEEVCEAFCNEPMTELCQDSLQRSRDESKNVPFSQSGLQEPENHLELVDMCGISCSATRWSSAHDLRTNTDRGQEDLIDQNDAHVTGHDNKSCDDEQNQQEIHDGHNQNCSAKDVDDLYPSLDKSSRCNSFQGSNTFDQIDETWSTCERSSFDSISDQMTPENNKESLTGHSSPEQELKTASLICLPPDDDMWSGSLEELLASGNGTFDTSFDIDDLDDSLKAELNLSPGKGTYKSSDRSEDTTYSSSTEGSYSCTLPPDCPKDKEYHSSSPSNIPPTFSGDQKKNTPIADEERDSSQLLSLPPPFAEDGSSFEPVWGESSFSTDSLSRSRDYTGSNLPEGCVGSLWPQSKESGQEEGTLGSVLNKPPESSVAGSSLESCDSSSDDSITYIFVTKESSPSTNNDNTNLQRTSQREATDGGHLTVQQPTPNSLSLDSLEQQVDQEEDTSHLSPRTLSIDSLVAEELLRQLRFPNCAKRRLYPVGAQSLHENGGSSSKSPVHFPPTRDLQFVNESRTSKTVENRASIHCGSSERSISPRDVEGSSGSPVGDHPSGDGEEFSKDSGIVLPTRDMFRPLGALEHELHMSEANVRHGGRYPRPRELRHSVDTLRKLTVPDGQPGTVDKKLQTSSNTIKEAVDVLPLLDLSSQTVARNLSELLKNVVELTAESVKFMRLMREETARGHQTSTDVRNRGQESYRQSHNDFFSSTSYPTGVTNMNTTKEYTFQHSQHKHHFSGPTRREDSHGAGHRYPTTPCTISKSGKKDAFNHPHRNVQNREDMYQRDSHSHQDFARRTVTNPLRSSFSGEGNTRTTHQSSFPASDAHVPLQRNLKPQDSYSQVVNTRNLLSPRSPPRSSQSSPRQYKCSDYLNHLISVRRHVVASTWNKDPSFPSSSVQTPSDDKRLGSCELRDNSSTSVGRSSTSSFDRLLSCEDYRELPSRTRRKTRGKSRRRNRSPMECKDNQRFPDNSSGNWCRTRGGVTLQGNVRPGWCRPDEENQVSWKTAEHVSGGLTGGGLEDSTSDTENGNNPGFRDLDDIGEEYLDIELRLRRAIKRQTRHLSADNDWEMGRRRLRGDHPSRNRKSSRGRTVTSHMTEMSVFSSASSGREYGPSWTLHPRNPHPFYPPPCPVLDWFPADSYLALPQHR